MLNIWGAKRSGGIVDPGKEMEDVHKCMAVLRAAEGRCVCSIHMACLSPARGLYFFRRWHGAGRLWCVDVEFCLFLVLIEAKYSGMFFMS